MTATEYFKFVPRSPTAASFGSRKPGRNFPKRFVLYLTSTLRKSVNVINVSFQNSQTRQTIDKLQSIVSTDGRFRNLRDALHRCDPPCIPYLGMYLTDLSFIEEGTPDFTEDGLLNFSKMRMVIKFRFG